MISENTTTTAALVATATTVSHWWQCADGLPQGTWCDYYPAGQPASAPSTHLLNDVSRVIGYYSLTPFLIVRMLTRTSASALIGLCLIFGGFFYDVTLGLPKANAAATAVSTSTIALLNKSVSPNANMTSLPIFHAKGGTPYVPGPPAPGDSLNLYPGGPYGQPVMVSLARRLALPSIWWMCAIILCVCLVRVAARLQGDSSCTREEFMKTSEVTKVSAIIPTAVTAANAASRSHRKILTAHRGSNGRFTVQQNGGKQTEEQTPQEEQISKPDDTVADGNDILPNTATSMTPGSEDENDYMTIYRPNAGKILVERKKNKRTQVPAQREKTVSKTDGKDSPGSMKVALLLAMLLLAAMMVPMAFAEPTSTKMSSSTLSLRSLLPGSAAHLTTSTVAYPNQTPFDLEKKNKPQSWIYGNPGMQHQAHPLWLLVPLLLMGNFLLPTLATVAVARWLRSDPLSGIATERQSSTSGTTDLEANTAADLQKRTAQGKPDPIWVTSYTTTTTYLPTVTVTAPAEPIVDPAAYTFGAAGDVWQPTPAGIEGICTERNLAVCPIVLGRKGWAPPVSVAPSVVMSKLALVVLIIGLAAVAVAETDYHVYLPVETVEATKTVSPAIEPRIAVDHESTHGLVGSPLQRCVTGQCLPSAMFTKKLDKQLLVRNPDTGTSACKASSSMTTTMTSTTSNIIAAGRHWAVNGSRESGADAGSGFAGVGAKSCAIASAIASGLFLLTSWYWQFV